MNVEIVTKNHCSPLPWQMKHGVMTVSDNQIYNLHVCTLKDSQRFKTTPIDRIYTVIKPQQLHGP